MLFYRLRRCGTVPIDFWLAGRLCPTLFLTVVLTGCGGSASSVSGTVTLDGRPLGGSQSVRVTVMFYPESGGAPAAARADARGGYVLSTGAQQGLASGNYVVAISANEVIPPKVEGGMPGMRALTPQRYADPAQSGLRAEVKPGRNTFDFDLKSDARG
jgi:hypothetical protein